MQSKVYRWQIPIVCILTKWSVYIGLRKLVYVTHPRRKLDPNDSQVSIIAMFDEFED
jgi:hypothetical protein